LAALGAAAAGACCCAEEGKTGNASRAAINREAGNFMSGALVRWRKT
jgi:hypothetical protein